MTAESSLVPEPELSREVRKSLTATFLGNPLYAYREVDSTNNILKKMAEGDVAEGATVIAANQLKGKGRRERVWISTPGEGVYMSTLLRPNISPSDVGLVSILGGIGIITALEKLHLKELSLKWPNDVLARNRKIAGVLVEPRLGGGEVDFVVLGIGVNVQQPPERWTGSLKETATSCHMEGSSACCSEVAAAVLNALDHWYHVLREGDNRQLMEAWARRGGKPEMPVID